MRCTDPAHITQRSKDIYDVASASCLRTMGYICAEWPKRFERRQTPHSATGEEDGFLTSTEEDATKNYQHVHTGAFATVSSWRPHHYTHTSTNAACLAVGMLPNLIDDGSAEHPALPPPAAIEAQPDTSALLARIRDLAQNLTTKNIKATRETLLSLINTGT